jgi:hypothetical protein
VLPSLKLKPPPRLHVLLRPGSPRSVVLRRGGSKTFCAIGWDLATDTFTVGQWCKHKIYTHRSDLSPDGTWMVYFALNGRWRSETRGAFTVVSRAPYLKARWLWPQGDTWGGGGLFYSAAPDGARLFPIAPRLGLAFGSFASYRIRLQRDGWSETADGLTRPVGSGWLLRKIVRAEPHESHQLLGDTVIDLPEWEWAEYDVPRRRVVWAEQGTIRTARMTSDGLGDSRLLFDARPMRFEAIAAPYDDETLIVE